MDRVAGFEPAGWRFESSRAQLASSGARWRPIRPHLRRISKPAAISSCHPTLPQPRNPPEIVLQAAVMGPKPTRTGGKPPIAESPGERQMPQKPSDFRGAPFSERSTSRAPQAGIPEALKEPDILAGPSWRTWTIQEESQLCRCFVQRMPCITAYRFWKHSKMLYWRVRQLCVVCAIRGAGSMLGKLPH